MSEYTNFEIGQKFPMPITTQADGAMFQIDANGAMFILQLSRTDVIAREAFRTGEMEFAFYEQDGLLFLLYQIDGIFKEGWGDAPLSLHNLKEGLMPTEKSLQDKTLHSTSSTRRCRSCSPSATSSYRTNASLSSGSTSPPRRRNPSRQKASARRSSASGPRRHRR